MCAHTHIYKLFYFDGWLFMLISHTQLGLHVEHNSYILSVSLYICPKISIIQQTNYLYKIVERSTYIYPSQTLFMRFYLVCYCCTINY